MKSFREQQRDKANQKATETMAKGDNMQNTAERLASMNQEDLTTLLMQQAAEAKRNGTLNEDTLRTFYDQMAPMLNEEQRQKLSQLIALIR